MTSAQQSFCPQCGTARQGALRYCSSCGFDYWKAAEASAAGAPPAATGTPPPPTNTPVEEPKAGRPWIRWLVIGVIALFVIGVIGSLANPDDETGSATGTPKPSATETPAVESEEAATPVVTASAIPTPDPEPAFAAIELSGSGNSVPRFEIPEDTVAIAEITHSGGANFVVWTLDDSGAQTDLLVNTIGAYSGTLLFDEQLGSHSVAFDVEADGAWTIVVRPVTEAFSWDGAETLSGTGDDVAILEPPSSGLKSVDLTHQGDANFAIWAYGSTTDLLVNEVGQYSGEVLLPDGTFLLEITANGAWTISPPQ
jgi:hypothetical protein